MARSIVPRTPAAFVGVSRHVGCPWRRVISLGYVAIAGSIEFVVLPIRGRWPDRVKSVRAHGLCGAFDAFVPAVRRSRLQPDFAANLERVARRAKPDGFEQHHGFA